MANHRDNNDDDIMMIMLEDEEESMVEEEQNEVLAQTETSRVKASKVLMYLFIGFVAAGAGWGTFLHTKQEGRVWYYDEVWYHMIILVITIHIPFCIAV